MEQVTIQDCTLAVERRGLPAEEAGLQLVWAHGWGQDHRAFLPMAEAMAGRAANLLIDFPGFGQSPVPDAAWDTADYAERMASWLATLPRPAGAKRVWIGHSFGCRVAVRLAARHPQSVDALLLIAGAGLQRKRAALPALKVKARIAHYKLLKAMARDDAARAALQERFGSVDYRNAGAMRPVFAKVVREDLSDEARRVACPVALLYGADDEETPPEFGRRYARLMPDARFEELPGLDHLSILTDGRHQVLHRLNDFVSRL